MTGDSVTNLEVVLFALADLGGGDASVHLEELAVRAFELAPGAFRWDLDAYASYVDKDKVRVSLTDAQKTKYGGLAQAVGPKKAGVSKPTDVWRLTSAGVIWARENQERLAITLQTQQPSLKKGKARRVRDRIAKSELYRAYTQTGLVEEDEYAFADLIECSPDANATVVRQRFDELMAQVQLLGEAELIAFLELSADRHSEMLNYVREDG